MKENILYLDSSHTAEKGIIIFNHVIQNSCFVVLAMAVKQPLDSQWQIAEASTSICQLSFFFIILLFLSDLNVAVFPLQLHLDRLRLQVFALPFTSKHQASLFSFSWFVFGAEVSPPLLLFLCSQCGNWTIRPSQTGSHFVSSKSEKRCQGCWFMFLNLLVVYHSVLNSIQLLNQKWMKDLPLNKGLCVRGISLLGDKCGPQPASFSETSALSPADRMISNLTSQIISITSFLFLLDHCLALSTDPNFEGTRRHLGEMCFFSES